MLTDMPMWKYRGQKSCKDEKERSGSGSGVWKSIFQGASIHIRYFFRFLQQFEETVGCGLWWILRTLFKASSGLGVFGWPGQASVFLGSGFRKTRGLLVGINRSAQVASQASGEVLTRYSQ